MPPDPVTAVVGPVQVVGAVIMRSGRVLAARRRTLAGRWEFPGGKVEPGESASAALVRECREELGVEIEPLAVIATSSDGRIELEIWTARLVSGEPAPGPDHDRFCWLAADGLGALDWLPLDAAVLPAVRGALDRLH